MSEDRVQFIYSILKRIIGNTGQETFKLVLSVFFMKVTYCDITFDNFIVSHSSY